MQQKGGSQRKYRECRVVEESQSEDLQPFDGCECNDRRRDEEEDDSRDEPYDDRQRDELRGEETEPVVNDVGPVYAPGRVTAHIHEMMILASKLRISRDYC